MIITFSCFFSNKFYQPFISKPCVLADILSAFSKLSTLLSVRLKVVLESPSSIKNHGRIISHFSSTLQNSICFLFHPASHLWRDSCSVYGQIIICSDFAQLINSVCWCFHLEICLYWMSPYWFQNVYPTFGNVFPSPFSVLISPLQTLPTFCSDLHWIFVLFCFILCFTTSINSKMLIKPDTGKIVLGLHLFCL